MNFDNDTLRDIITSALGVVIGGLITVKVNNVTNSKVIKKTHALSMLQRIKELLTGWSGQLSADMARAFELEDINNFQAVTHCKELESLIVYFETNLSVLKEFNKTFKHLRQKELFLKMAESEFKTKLVNLANNHKTVLAQDLYEIDEGERIYESYAAKVGEITMGIHKLIVSIDVYIEKKILR